MLKKCSKCDVEKDEEKEFEKRGKKRKGVCKACKKLWRQTPKQKEYRKKYAKEYRKSEKYLQSEASENRIAYRKSYNKTYAKTPAFAKSVQKYKKSDKYKESILKTRSTIKNKFPGAKCNAMRRAIDFTLTLSEYCELLSESAVCFYCGNTPEYIFKLVDGIKNSTSECHKIQKMKHTMKGFGYKSTFLTLDRIDSFGNYTLGNCCAACMICNQAKGWAIPADQYKLIAPAAIANIVNICKEAGLEI